MSSISETPRDEMQRLIKVVAGKRLAGETDEQLRFRAAHRLRISDSRAKVFWYGDTDNIRSDEMDRARELAFVQPIDEAINAVEAAERAIEALALDGCLGLADRVLAGLQRRLAARFDGSGVHGDGAAGDGVGGYGRRAQDLPLSGAALPPRPASTLTPRSVAPAVSAGRRATD